MYELVFSQNQYGQHVEIKKNGNLINKKGDLIKNSFEAAFNSLNVDFFDAMRNIALEKKLPILDNSDGIQFKIPF